MDSLRLIYFRPRNPSWIWIRYVQHAFHKHHRNLLCRFERHSALDKFPFLLWSTVMETTHASPRNTRHTKLHGGLEYFPHTSNDTLSFQHLAKPFRLKHPTSLNTTSLAAPRTNRLKAANKELSLLCYQRIVSQFISVAIKSIVFGKIINSHKTAIIVNSSTNYILTIFVFLFWMKLFAKFN